MIKQERIEQIKYKKNTAKFHKIDYKTKLGKIKKNRINKQDKFEYKHIKP